MPDTGTKTLGDVLASGIYRIPSYQRGYAWTSDEVNELIDDLEYVTDHQSVQSHYINSIIVTEPEEEDIDGLHIIDGQQRVITSALLASEILRTAEAIEDSADAGLTHIGDEISKKLHNDIYHTIRSGSVLRRVLPATEHQEIFKALMPKDPNEPRNLEALEAKADSPSEQKLVGTVKVIRERIDDMLQSCKPNAQDRLLYLDRLATTLHGKFIATLHEVANPSEAGRIFEAINDRGRALNRIDKIKSYVVYRASLSDVGMNVTNLHEQFTQVYETLNRYAPTPDQVDKLVDRMTAHHWTMFGEPDKIERSDDLVGRHKTASQDIDQIKHAKYHIPKEASDERVQQWMSTYVDSLRRSADAYIHFRGVLNKTLFNQLAERLPATVDAKAIRHSLYVAEKFGPSTTHPLLIAVFLRFADTEAYGRVLKAIERFVIRVFAVCSARRDTKRSKIEPIARALFWAGRDDLTDVFPEDSSIVAIITKNQNEYDFNGSLDDADRLIDILDGWARDYCYAETSDGRSVDEFERRLAEDNLNGHGEAGWSGLRPPNVRNYLLYWYEAAIRRGGVGLPDFFENDVHDFTVEHVWPQTNNGETYPADLDEETYERYLNRFGNLALLSLSENVKAGNNDYETKWNRIYRDASDGTAMVRKDFPDPEGKISSPARDKGYEAWSTDLIEWRSKRMARTLAQHWGLDDGS